MQPLLSLRIIIHLVWQSHADEQITKRLKEALALIDVRVLDHIVVGDECVSFAERGLL